MKREEFTKDIKDWDNHRGLLWLSLEATNGSVLELGCGDGSTPYLQKYCTERELTSLDYNKEWADKFGATYVNDWNTVNLGSNISVALIDESPGEHRKESINYLTNNAEIIIVHDSEPKGWNCSNYEVRDLFGSFKYKVDVKSKEKEGAWATALSNTIDITKWIGEKFGEYEVIAYQN